MAELTYQYTKKRCDFGRQPLFCEQGPDMCDSIITNVAEHKQYILRNPVHQASQNTPNFSENLINTIRVEFANTGINHAEGGWPKDVNVLDPEATQRYRRKVEKEDTYIRCIMNCSDNMEHYIDQNNAIDMYDIYFSELSEMPPLEKNSIRTINVYRDTSNFKAPGRPVSSICWQPEAMRFAVTYVDVDYDRNPRNPISAFIWDIENANTPEIIITPPCALLDLQYNNRDTNILAGGLINGQVGVWDRRIGGAPTLTCPPHVAHRDLVRSVLFINAKSGQEFFSASPDGAVKWWDIRNMSDPTDVMIIDVPKSSFDVPGMATSTGPSVLEFEYTIPTRFMVGTENGLVIGGNRKGKTPMEKLPNKYETHLGPVFSLERNPGFLKNFLTVGDWTARVWSEDCKESAVLWSAPQRYKITTASWSPTKLSLMLTGQQNGVISLWDFLKCQHSPSSTMHVCHEPLLRLKLQENGSFVACGSSNGNIYMVELSASLQSSNARDKSLLTAVLEREGKRERILEARMREIRLKLRQAEEGTPVASVTDLEGAIGDRDLAEATTEYMQTVKKELSAM